MENRPPDPSIYPKLYATLLGRVDMAVDYLEDMIDRRAFDWARTIQVTELLKTALLEAEEIYLSAKEMEPPKLIILSPEEDQ